MKIKKIYSNSADLEDLTKDKAIIEMNGEEFSQLLAALRVASYENKVLHELIEKFDSANKLREVIWTD